jgi:hypothetical protein
MTSGDGAETRTDSDEAVNLTERLLAIAAKAVDKSGGGVRLVHNEEDDTAEPQPEAAHFLKAEDKRLGRDIELYGFMGEVAGRPAALSYFLEEIAMPLKGVLEPEAHTVVMTDIEQLGDEVCPEDLRASWHAIFTE